QARQAVDQRPRKFRALAHGDDDVEFRECLRQLVLVGEGLLEEEQVGPVLQRAPVRALAGDGLPVVEHGYAHPVVLHCQPSGKSAPTVTVSHSRRLAWKASSFSRTRLSPSLPRIRFIGGVADSATRMIACAARSGSPGCLPL